MCVNSVQADQTDVGLGNQIGDAYPLQGAVTDQVYRRPIHVQLRIARTASIRQLVVLVGTAQLDIGGRLHSHLLLPTLEV